MPARPPSKAATGTQTLLRGLDLLEAVAEHPASLDDLADALDLPRWTTYRLAGALAQRKYLAVDARRGFRLGAKILELGWRAEPASELVQCARPHLERLATLTGDEVTLGARDADAATLLHKSAGRRGLARGERMGERLALTSTAIGRALLLDEGDKGWRTIFAAERGAEVDSLSAWVDDMKKAARKGHLVDGRDNGAMFCSVAAPVRDAAARIVAAISVTAPARSLEEVRLQELAGETRATAAAIGRDLARRAPRKSPNVRE